MEETRNCKEYCRYSRLCWETGRIGMDPEECVRFYKIDDLLLDARYSHDDYNPDEIEDEEEIDE